MTKPARHCTAPVEAGTCRRDASVRFTIHHAPSLLRCEEHRGETRLALTRLVQASEWREQPLPATPPGPA